MWRRHDPFRSGPSGEAIEIVKRWPAAEEQWTSVRWSGREGHVWRFHSIGLGAMRGRTQLLQSGSDSAAGGTSQAPRGGTSAQDDGRIKSEAPTHRLRHEAAGKDLLGPKLSSAMNGYNRCSSPWNGS